MSTNIGTTQLSDALHWRYAAKIFDARRKIPSDIWTAIEQTLVLSPSSYGLQPYRFLVVNDPQTRAALLSHAFSQPKVVDASHYVVFAARTSMTEADVDKLIQRTSAVRGVPASSLDAYRGAIVGDLVNGPRSK